MCKAKENKLKVSASAGDRKQYKMTQDSRKREKKCLEMKRRGKEEEGGRKETRQLYGNMKGTLNHVELILYPLVNLGLRESPLGQSLV